MAKENELGEVMEKPENPVPKFDMLDKNKVVEDLRSEYVSLEQGYQEAMTRREQSYKQYAMQQYGIETDGRSKIVDSTIFDKVEWMSTNVLRPIVEGDDVVNTVPEKPSAVLAAEAQRELLTLQLKRKQNWHMINHDVIKNMFIAGQSYAKCNWIAQDKDNYVGYMKWQPIPNWQIRYDWDATDFYASRVVCHDTDVTASDLLDMKQNKNFFDIDEVLKTPGSDRKGEQWTITDNERQLHNAYLSDQHTQAQRAGKWYRLHEQWTLYDTKGEGKLDKIVAIWCNNTLIRLQVNPMPDKEKPFLQAQALREPFEAHGWDMAMILGDIQKMKTMIDRDIIDNLAAQNNGMYEVVSSDVDIVSQQILRAGVSNSVVPVTRKDSIKPLMPAPIAQQVFAMRELLSVDADNRSGFTKSSSLDTKMLRSTATGANIVSNTGQMRIWEIAARYVSTFIVPGIRKNIAFNKALIKDVSLQRVFGENQGQWLEIRGGDLEEDVDVSIELSLAGDKQEKLQNMLQYAQYFSPLAEQIPEIQQILRLMAVEGAKLMRLNRVEALFAKGQTDAESPISLPEFGGESQEPSEPSPAAQSEAGGVEEESPLQGIDLEGLAGEGSIA